MQPSSDSSPSLPSLDFSFFSRYLTVCVRTASLFLHSFFPPAPFVSITSDIYHLAPRAPAPSVPYPTSINHPNFSCISPTQYAMKVPGHYLPNIVHVNHIAVCLQYDEEVRKREGIQGIESIPLGFAELAEAWNDGVSSHDSRCISRVTTTSNPAENLVEPANYPLLLQDFHITDEQLGLVHPEGSVVSPKDEVSACEQREIMQAYAYKMLTRQRHQVCGFEERQKKRARAQGPTKSSSQTNVFSAPLTFKAKCMRTRPANGSTSTSKSCTYSLPFYQYSRGIPQETCFGSHCKHFDSSCQCSPSLRTYQRHFSGPHGDLNLGSISSHILKR